MVVFDASTLILLAKTDLLPLLTEKTRVLIPEAVEREALAKPELYDARVIAGLLHSRKIQAFKDPPAQQCKRLQGDFALEVGEAASLLLARDKRLPLGTDDGPSIKAAKLMGIPFLTAIHVVVELCEKGRLDKPTALAKLERLQQVGRYSVQILEDARKRIQRGR
jgi:predicted nucleic acid-binding protein